MCAGIEDVEREVEATGNVECDVASREANFGPGSISAVGLAVDDDDDAAEGARSSYSACAVGLCGVVLVPCGSTDEGTNGMDDASRRRWSPILVSASLQGPLIVSLSARALSGILEPPELALLVLNPRPRSVA